MVGSIERHERQSYGENLQNNFVLANYFPQKKKCSFVEKISQKSCVSRSFPTEVFARSKQYSNIKATKPSQGLLCVLNWKLLQPPEMEQILYGLLVIVNNWIIKQHKTKKKGYLNFIWLRFWWTDIKSIYCYWNLSSIKDHNLLIITFLFKSYCFYCLLLSNLIIFFAS